MDDTTNAQHYNYSPHWENNRLFSPWIKKSAKGPEYTSCKVCRTDFKSTKGFSALRDHMFSNKHQRKKNTKQDSKSNSFITSEIKKEDINDINESLEYCPRRQSTNRNLVCYNPKWEKIHPFSQWVTSSSRGKYWAFCKACHKHFSIGLNGKFCLQMHEKGKKHKKNLQEHNNETQNFCPQTLEGEINGISVKILDAATDLNYDPHSETINISEKPLYSNRYNPRWELEPNFSSWLASSSKGDAFGFCRICQVDLDITSSSKTALERHAKGKKHLKYVESPNLLPAPNLEEDVNAIDNKSSQATYIISASGKKIYMQLYNKKWERESIFQTWLRESPKGPMFANCKACNKDLIVRRGGRSDVLAHSMTKKHKKNVQLQPLFDLSLLCDNHFLAKNVREKLPRLSDDQVKELVHFLINDLGVEEKEDLVHVEPSDLSGILRPIQARKIIKLWNTEFGSKQECMDLTDSSPFGTISPMHLGKDGHSLDLACGMPEDFTQSVAAIQNLEPSFKENSQNIGDEMNLGMQDTFFDLPDGNIQEETVVPTSSHITVDDSYPLKPSSYDENSIRESVTHGEDMKIDEEDLQKGLWVQNFAISSDCLSPELLESLHGNVKIPEKGVGQLVRAIADKIYETYKKPHIDDLRTISLRLINEFASLRDIENDDCSGYEKIFSKLRNRIYTLRKRKSMLLRRERKKAEKLRSATFLSL